MVVNEWFMLVVLVVVVAWASVLLYQERRSHNRTLDRLMALADQPEGVSAPDGGYFWIDAETGERRPVVQGNHTGIEDVEGTMGMPAVDENTVLR